MVWQLAERLVLSPHRDVQDPSLRYYSEKLVKCFANV